MRRQGRKSKQLWSGLTETTEYWKLKEEALDRTVWRTRFGRSYGPVVTEFLSFLVKPLST